MLRFNERNKEKIKRKENFYPEKTLREKNCEVNMGKEKNKNQIIKILKDELKQNVMDFLNHEYIKEKIENRDENTAFIMELYDTFDEINSIVRVAIKNKKVPAVEVLTEEEVFRRVIEYNKQAKEAKNKADKKKAKRFYEMKATLLKKYGRPLCIHSLKGGYKVVLVQLRNGTFHCPIDYYSLDEIENLKVEDFRGTIE